MLAWGLLAATGITTACRSDVEDPAVTSELTQLANLGRAHLETRDSEGAVTTYERAVELAPDLPAAWRNLARSQLLARNPEQALESLARAAALEEESAATSYLTGIAHGRLGRRDEALPHFETAVALDPRSPPLRYQLAASYQAVGRHGLAEAQLREVIRLDPWHATAYYRLARYAAADGRVEERERWNREFLHLREVSGRATRSAEELEVSAYTAAEPMGEAAASEGGALPAGEPLPVRFTDVTDRVFLEPPGGPGRAVCLLDTAPGGYTMAVIGPSPRLLTWRDGRFEAAPLDAPIPPDVFRCRAANYHDEAVPGEPFDPRTQALRDLVLLGADGARLWLRTGPRSFRDATREAGLAGLTARTARWVDSEHDGDLDLVVGTDTGLELWQNRGDGSFRRVAGALALPDAVAPVLDVEAADLEADVAVDLVVAREGAPSAVLRGGREGTFSPELEPPGPRPAARRVLLNDLDNDGEMDAVFVGEDSVTVQSALGGPATRLEPEGLRMTAALLLDHDNDGLLDLWVAGRDPGGAGGLRAWRNEGAGGWSEATDALGLEPLTLDPVADLTAGDLDGDGDTDLLAHTAGGVRFLRNDGGDAHGQLKVHLLGTKTNPDGLGTLVEVVAGAYRVSRATTHLPLEVGLRDHDRLDSVRTVWTNGVVDHQVEVEGRTLTIEEKNVATGSCPFLYAWDGEGFRFVTDLLGNSPVGLPIRRGEPLPADPEEIVWLGEAGRLAPWEGAYRLLITSEFREVLYLDQVELLAVDHPPDVEVHPTDKIMQPPFPPSELWPLAGRRPLRQARAGGDDLTEVLRATDGRFAPPGVPLPPPLRGMTYPRQVTLDFGPLDPGRPWVMALTGWLQYGDASTNIALSQHPGVTVMPPVLEAEVGTGTWVELPVTVGLPAGKTKTILCDLAGAIPEGARRLRLSTTFEVRWDRIALFERAPEGSHPPVHRLRPGGAALSFRGFSELRARKPGHPTTPDPDRLSRRPPWRTVLTGWSTRYGPVGELLEARDGRLAIVSSGDALEVRFDSSSLPPVPDGLRRSVFLRSVGWEKDGDHNVTGGDRIAPLPGAAPGPWRSRYNTRYVPEGLFRPSPERDPAKPPEPGSGPARTGPG